MKRTKKMDWSKHAAVLIITIFVFFTGILLGYLLSKNKIENVESSSNFNNGLKQFD